MFILGALLQVHENYTARYDRVDDFYRKRYLGKFTIGLLEKKRRGKERERERKREERESGQRHRENEINDKETEREREKEAKEKCRERMRQTDRMNE